MNSKRMKKLLIVLYEMLDGDSAKIVQELLEKNLNLTEEQVNDYIKKSKIKLTDYHCGWEKRYPKHLLEKDIPVIIYKRN